MHTILVADDSETILRAVEIVFDKEPFTVVRAGSGSEAMARAADSRPHLVLVDHTMPDKSGYEVAEALRANPATAEIPILILSTTAVPYDEGRAKAAGVLGHVPKPFDCTSLLDRVKTILGVTASGPVAGVVTAAATPAAVAATPRPPSGLPGMTRTGVPPAGLPRPPSGGPSPGVGTGSFAQQIASSAFGSGAPASAAASASPPRAPTPMPARDLDPFGFGPSLSQPPAAAARPANPFSGASASVPAAISTPPMAVPPVVRPLPRAAESDFEVSLDDISPSVSAAAVSTPPSVQTLSDAEFMEVSDHDLAASASAAKPVITPISGSNVISAEKITAKIDGDRLARMDREDAASGGASGNGASARSTPPAAGLTAAAEQVAARAAQEVAATGAPVSAQALTAEARAIVERIAWEVVPELAETIIREEIKRLLQQK